MRKRLAVVELHQVDPVLLARLVASEKVCLGVSAAIGVLAIASDLLAPRGIHSLAWIGMTVMAAVATLACTLSLALSFATESLAARIAGRVLAIGVVAIGLAQWIAAHGLMSGVRRPVTPVYPAEFPGLIAVTFALLGISLLVLRIDKGAARFAADGIFFGLALLVLTLVSGSIFRALPAFGIPPGEGASNWTVFALALLTFASFGRRMECGVFAIMLGPGHGSRFARGLLPILVVLPILREMGRARIVATRLLPRHYAAATLASIAIMVSIALLMWIAYYFRRLEIEIHDLSLRDELTGLYNLRGFRLLAEQALRLAQRSQQPFSVMFVDVDGLKQVNDELGHGAGSMLLIEAAELLRSSFRETDVVGRIGGDEFVVAGQFSQEAIVRAAERLAEESEQAGDSHPQAGRLRMSMGNVTANPREHVSLQNLLDRADAAMYEHKRSKKPLVI